MKKIKKLNNKGFAMTGVLYMSLLIFLILIVSLLNMFLSRKNVLDKLKDNAIATVTPYPVYYNGMPVYYNPEKGLKCTQEEYNSNPDKLGKTGCLKWYTFNDNNSSSTVNMILDHNTTSIVAWNSSGSNSEMKEIKVALENDIATWNNEVKTTARLITADEIAEITSNKTFDSATTTSSEYFYFETNSTIEPSPHNTNYAWLYDYTHSCTDYGCNVGDLSTYGYWTSTPVVGSSIDVWRVGRRGYLHYGNVVITGYDCGVRPVITVSKSSIFYPEYDNGSIVYFNPVSGLECSASEAVSTPGTTTGCMKWHIFNDSSTSSTVNMILDHNTSSPVAWKSSKNNADGMNEVKKELDKLQNDYNWSVVPRLIRPDEVVKIVNNDNWNISNATTDDWFFLENKIQENPNLSQGEAKYEWLFNQLLECDQYGCSNTGGANYSGYWTSAGVVSDPTKAWIISAYGKLVSIDVDHTGHSGVRPVITLHKSSFSNVNKIYQLTNLISNGSFEDDLTNYGFYNSNKPTISTENVKYGSKSLYVDSSYTNATEKAVVYNKGISLIEGHKYLRGINTYVESYKSGDTRMFYVSGLTNFAFDSTKIAKWDRVNYIATATSSRLSNDIRIGHVFAQEGNWQAYFDGVIFVDLTEAFGAGNEPDKEWCDQNIDYFDGTTVIIK